MSLSVFVTISNPEKRQDLYKEALDCYRDLADELIIIDGSGSRMDGFTIESLPNTKVIYHKWPEEFKWDFIGEQFQRGYEACQGDWVIRADLDFIWHEEDIKAIREFLKDCDAPVACMVKRQLLKHNSYAIKALVPIAFNKKKYGNRIKLNAGGDLCQPSLDGVEINKDDMPVISRLVPTIIDESVSFEQKNERLPKTIVKDGVTYAYGDYIPIYNYECLLRTEKVEAKEFYRFARAWGRTFGENMFEIESEQDALKEFIKMQIGRYKNSNQIEVKLADHPKYIRDTIEYLRSEQFGHSLWGLA